ncbi:hypothetical protein GPECTOR_1g209 [Gonium pectorale]|uniref:Uncharacterized protein n=1 Tax=Gonium pectorale TaxID=33097 RepID=A0A150H3V0_GONPE|nr:hypothetical protein GPECTOR_1g209 [Gonium pectorale]|eukprot:KXZ56240.1 hypothetical protein GPECTOR_1g209 [Gonium pectorale]
MLPAELRPGGSAFATVDWRQSLCLNLVVQAKYLLTVVQCRQDVLAAVAHEHASSNAHWHNPHLPPPAGAVVAQRRVFASPMAADVNLEGARSGKPPLVCYPDVSFAVDNFEDAFEDMELVADYLAAKAARAPQPSLLHRLLGAPRRADGAAAGGQRDRIVLSGPGGIGRAEAVATAVPAGGGSGAVGPAVAAGGGARASALQLSLMWMSLPAQALAQTVLRFACS